MEPLFRQEVTSEVVFLQELHSQYPWIPGEDSIRPSDAVKAIKLETLQVVDATWVSFDDYLLCTVFGKPKAKTGEKIFYCADREISKAEKVFRENEYPYANLQESHHWIMWYGCKLKPYDSSQISLDICNSLRDHLRGNDKFDFVWYENPKMSLPEFYHVHVFWIHSFVMTGRDDLLI